MWSYRLRVPRSCWASQRFFRTEERYSTATSVTIVFHDVFLSHWRKTRLKESSGCPTSGEENGD